MPVKELEYADSLFCSVLCQSLHKHVCVFHLKAIRFWQKVDHSVYCLLGSRHEFSPKENNLYLFLSHCVPDLYTFAIVLTSQHQSSA